MQSGRHRNLSVVIQNNRSATAWNIKWDSELARNSAFVSGSMLKRADEYSRKAGEFSRLLEKSPGCADFFKISGGLFSGGKDFFLGEKTFLGGNRLFFLRIRSCAALRRLAPPCAEGLGRAKKAKSTEKKAQSNGKSHPFARKVREILRRI